MILIIGAGPIGTYIAKKLAQKGYFVSIYEEHESIGKPVHCTGLVTKEFFEYVTRSDYVLNELSGARINAERTLDLNMKEYVLDREKLDKYLAKQAVLAGARIYLRHKFIGIKNGKAVFRIGDKLISVQYDYLIGADGPLSTVAKEINSPNTKFLSGIQARIKGEFDSKFDVYFDTTNFFSWNVPESKTIARIGLGGNNQILFKQKLAGKKLIEYQGGLIPYYTLKAVQKDNLYLVGDAGSFVKDTTGGGLISGFQSADACVQSIVTGKSYEKYLKPLRKRLMLHSRIRRILNKFTEKDYAELIRLLSSNRCQKAFNNADREKPAKLLSKLVFIEPRLLKFLFFGF